MQRTAEVVDQSVLESFESGEIIVENNGCLTRGIITGMRIHDSWVDITFRDVAYKSGTLDDADDDGWNVIGSQTSVLVSRVIESGGGNTIVLAPTTQQTRARLVRLDQSGS